MKKILMSGLIAATLAAALMTAAIEIAPPVFAQVSLGIRIGPPPAPRVLRNRPRQPGSDYVWVEGYWYPNTNGKNYRWHDGYWTRPPFAGAQWVAPHHDGQRFFDGFWQGGDRRVDHDHHSDRDRDRDYHR